MNIEPPLPGAIELVTYLENSNFNVCATRVQSHNTLVAAKMLSFRPSAWNSFCIVRRLCRIRLVYKEQC